MYGIDEMAEVTSQPVEFPDDQRVAGAERLNHRQQSRTRIQATRGLILVEMRGIDSGVQQRITLEIGRLRAVRLRDAYVAN
jgi:hypothetical protein